MRLRIKNLSPLGKIYAVSIILSIIWVLLFGPIQFSDTPGYLAAYTNNLAHGRIDTFRTPLYPLLLGLTQKAFGAKLFPWIVLFLQYAVFLISIKYVYKSAIKFLPENWSLAVTAFYAIYPTFGPWSNILLTESLELSFSVFLMYACLKLIYDEDWKYVIGVFVWVFLLLALRPSSVAFLPALAFTFFLLLFKKQKRRNAILGLVCVIATSIILLGYSSAVEKRTGLFTPSIVSVHNNYWIAGYYGYLDHEVDLNTTDAREVQELVRESSLKNKKGWIAGLGRRFYDASLMPSLTSYTSQILRLHPLYPINIGMVILLLLVYMILLLPVLPSKLPIGNCFLLVTSGSIILLSIIGAQYEWNRLILPAQPMILIIIAQLSVRMKDFILSYSQDKTI